jgi:hypothetical protein
VTALSATATVYQRHEALRTDYENSEYTDETGTLAGQMRDAASRARGAADTAVGRYKTLGEFDAALEADYAAFETPLFRLEGASAGLGPFSTGMAPAVRGRSLWTTGVEQYAAGEYRDALNTFTDAVDSFNDARVEFRDSEEDLAGPMKTYLSDYICETTAGQTGARSYRQACRDQLNGDESAAAESKAEAEERYTRCGTDE